VLQTRQDFHDLAMAYFDRAAADGVRHAEIMFDPQTHTDRGVPFAEVIEGLLSAMAQAQARHGLSSA
jgi:adenosine deaminase